MHRLHHVLQFFETSLKISLLKIEKHRSKHCIVKQTVRCFKWCLRFQNPTAFLLTQCHQVPIAIAFYWPSTIIYQPVPLHTDPVPPGVNQYRPILTQYHHVSTSATLNWPSTTKCLSVPIYTDPLQSCINQYHPILTQYHQVPTSTAYGEPLDS